MFIGLCFAIPLGVIASATVHAQSTSGEQEGDECADCHEITQNHWQESAHGQAFSDPEYQMAWREQGSPDECLACHTTGFDPAAGSYEADSVACATCHNPEPAEHPQDIMPTDISSRLCGSCHLESHDDWQQSGHAQEDLACVRCHNAHTTDLRAGAVQELCQSCHNDTTHYYNNTTHAEAGLLCSDCHLRVADSKPGEGHAKRSHTFMVDLQTCAGCHEDQMHTALSAQVEQINAPAVQDKPVLSMASAPIVQTEPDPVGPMGFAVLATLVGLGFGIVVAPWLTNRSRQLNQEKKDE